MITNTGNIGFNTGIPPTGGGGGSDANYVHIQGNASTTWTIPHNLGKRCSVSVVDSLQREMLGDVTYLSDNLVMIIFSVPISGYAYCN